MSTVYRASSDLNDLVQELDPDFEVGLVAEFEDWLQKQRQAREEGAADEVVEETKVETLSLEHSSLPIYLDSEDGIFRVGSITMTPNRDPSLECQYVLLLELSQPNGSGIVSSRLPALPEQEISLMMQGPNGSPQYIKFGSVEGVDDDMVAIAFQYPQQVELVEQEWA